jgi:hypothetical protein
MGGLAVFPMYLKNRLSRALRGQIRVVTPLLFIVSVQARWTMPAGFVAFGMENSQTVLWNLSTSCNMVNCPTTPTEEICLDLISVCKVVSSLIHVC